MNEIWASDFVSEMFYRCNVLITLYTLDKHLVVGKNKKKYNQGPVVQSVVSLTSSLTVISLTILVDSIYNILIFLLKKM